MSLNNSIEKIKSIDGTSHYINATNANEVAFGKFNSTSDDTLFSVGCGSSDTKRKNAMEIKNDDGSVSVIFNGAVTATSFDQSSDERLKIFKY